MMILQIYTHIEKKMEEERKKFVNMRSVHKNIFIFHKGSNSTENKKCVLCTQVH